MKWHFGTSWRDSVAGLRGGTQNPAYTSDVGVCGKIGYKNKDEIPINRQSLSMT